jgi:hypothetical protein
MFTKRGLPILIHNGNLRTEAIYHEELKPNDDRSKHKHPHPIGRGCLCMGNVLNN